MGLGHHEQGQPLSLGDPRVERLSLEWASALNTYVGIVGKPETNHLGQGWVMPCALVPEQENSVQIRCFIHIVSKGV